MICVLISAIASFAHAQKYRGNPIVQHLTDSLNTTAFFDPIDDTISYKRVIDKLYRDSKGRIYLLTVAAEQWNDSLIMHAYFHDYTSFFKLKTYQSISEDYFINNGKVYIWFLTSDGHQPVEIKEADHKTFKPFDTICGGTDRHHVFYGGPEADIRIVKGANPKTIVVLNPKDGCWNCNTSYFKDDKNVYYRWERIDGADPETFALSEEKHIDCTDKYGKYRTGKRQ